MLRRRISLSMVFLPIILSLVIYGCTPAAAPTTEVTPAEKEAVTTEETATAEASGEVRTIRVGLSWNEKIHALIQAWQDYMQKYGEEYGAKNGIKFEWIINVADGDPARQQANIEDLIGQKVDVIIVRAQDAAAIGASIKAAEDAGIPIVTLDRESSTIKPDAHVGSDAYSVARSSAEYLADLLEEKGVKGKAIELLGDLVDMNAVYFSQAWNDVGKERGQWDTVIQEPTEWKPEKFRSGITTALAAHPEANVLFVASDYCFSSVESGLEEAGRLAPTGDPKHMWTATTACGYQGYEAMLKGYIDVATTWDAYLVSVEVIRVIVPLVLGEISIGTRHLVPGRIATPDTVDNMPNLWVKEYKE